MNVYGSTPEEIATCQDAQHAKALAEYQTKYQAWLANEQLKAANPMLAGEFPTFARPVKPRHPNPAKR